MALSYGLLFELNLCVRFCVHIFPTIFLPFRSVAAATCCAPNMRQPYFEKTVLYSAMQTVLEVNSVISISPKFLLHVLSLNTFYWKLCYHSRTKPCMQRHGQIAFVCELSQRSVYDTPCYIIYSVSILCLYTCVGFENFR